MSYLNAKQAGSLQINHLWFWLFIVAALVFGYFFSQGFSTTKQVKVSDSQLSLLNPVTESQEPAATEIVLEDDEDRRELVTNLAFNVPVETPTVNTPKAEVDNKTVVAISSAAAEQQLTIAKPLKDTDLENNTAILKDIDVDPQELRSLMKIDINYLIEQWRQAWQSGDSEAYLSFYSSQFMPSGDITYSSWLQQRKRMVQPSKQITLSLTNFDVILDEANQQSIVSFDQEYVSSSHSDTSRKQLTLIKETHWRILAETVID